MRAVQPVWEESEGNRHWTDSELRIELCQCRLHFEKETKLIFGGTFACFVRKSYTPIKTFEPLQSVF